MTSAPEHLWSVVPVATGPQQITLGPDHPTLDGMPAVRLRVEGDVVRTGEWVPGHVHRGVEKLFESRDYRQIVMLADRHAWLSAFCSEIGVVVGVERALGLTPPPRAQQVRILLAELTRIAHHLAFLAPLPADALPAAWRAAAWGWRAEVLDLLEAATGQRVHPMFCQVGGVRADVPAAWVEQARAATEEWRNRDLRAGGLAEVADQLTGVAVLEAADARTFGASGPVARASGVDLDLRRDDPTLPYPGGFAVPVRTAGDAAARIDLLVEEISVSVTLVAWAADRLTQSAGEPVSVRLPKVVRVPEGSSYTWTEGPGGINGYLLVSRNDRTPWRLKLRSAGFGNAAALGAALPGTALRSLPAALASFLLVCGDVDR